MNVSESSITVYHFDADGHQLLNEDGSAALLKVDRMTLPPEVQNAADLSLAMQQWRGFAPGVGSLIAVNANSGEMPVPCTIPSNACNQQQTVEHSEHSSATVEFSSSSNKLAVLHERNDTCDTDDDGGYRWTSNSVHALIELYGEHAEKFENSKRTKKQVWQLIAGEMNKNGFKVNWDQCDRKFKSLKRTYKTIRDHNNKSGRDRRSWEFYDSMDKYLDKKPEVNPISVCNTSRGVVQHSQLEDSVMNENSKKEPKKRKTISLECEALMEASERRHREKIQCFNRFLDIMDKLANEK